MYRVIVLQREGMVNMVVTRQLYNRKSLFFNGRYSVLNSRCQVHVPRYPVYLHNVQYNELQLIRKCRLNGNKYYHQRHHNWQWYSRWYKHLTVSVSLLTIFGLGNYYFNKVECNCQQNKNEKYEEKKKSARELLMKIKDEYGCPGVVVSVSVDGQPVWSEGIGYANIENHVPCSPDSVMRIASISKPISMVLLAKLWEDGKVDLDKPVEEYVKEWPKKTFNGEKVTITTRQLVSHMSGIRHYDKNCGKKSTNEKSKSETAKTGNSEKELKDSKNKVDKSNSAQNTKTENKPDGKTKKSMPEFEQKEYFLKRKFPNVASSLNLFKEDELCSKPGTQFLYSTHGYTLISAVIESVSGKSFPTLAKQLFVDLGLENTFLDDYEPVIYNRASYYVRNKNGKLMNAPYVDLSYKWAGGGFISTVHDIVKFGNAMLCSFQQSNSSHNGTVLSSKSAGYLKPETVKMMWTPISDTGWSEDSGWYGIGWGVMPEIERYTFGRQRKFCVSHTGGAMGASSVLLVMPTVTEDINTADKSEAEIAKHRHSNDIAISNKSETEITKHGVIANNQNGNESNGSSVPSGIVVGIIVNMQGVNLNPAALKIANIFNS